MSLARSSIRSLLIPCALALGASSPHASPPASGTVEVSIAAPTSPAAVPAYPPSPQILFKDLFVAVQTAAIYGDGKTFADATPRSAPARVLSEYHAAQPTTSDDLKRFTDEHFIVPTQVEPGASPPDRMSIVQHIDRLWSQLTRRTPEVPRWSSLLSLPEPYVVPGGRFREIYYWDSYFTMLGLRAAHREDLLKSMVADFAYLIDTYGHVPNGARTYYLSRSQPPFFFEMVGLLEPSDPAAAYADYLPQLRREHAFWMQGERGLRPGSAHRRVVALADGSILNRYWDDRDTPRDEAFREDVELARGVTRPHERVYRDIRAAAESGWDFSSRWFADGRTRSSIETTEIVPVDLNSLMFGLESAIRAGCERARERACAEEFAARAARRRAAMDRYSWDPTEHVYRDYRWTERVAIGGVSAATLYPLFLGVASHAQGERVAAATLRDLLKPGGLVTTPTDTGQQWDAPNGWAPLQWIAIDGLRRYGQATLAEAIACRWIVNVLQVYRRTGKLVEKYDVVTTDRPGGGGEYPLQDGFGWTNGVTRRLIADYPSAASLTKSAQCPRP